jgi:hypothetical protein
MLMECVRQIEGVKDKLKGGEDLGRQTIFTTLLTDDESKPATWALKGEA